jgi:hypothetical protein
MQTYSLQPLCWMLSGQINFSGSQRNESWLLLNLLPTKGYPITSNYPIPNFHSCKMLHHLYRWDSRVAYLHASSFRNSKTLACQFLPVPRKTGLRITTDSARMHHYQSPIRSSHSENSTSDNDQQPRNAPGGISLTEGSTFTWVTVLVSHLSSLRCIWKHWATRKY